MNTKSLIGTSVEVILFISLQYTLFLIYDRQTFIIIFFCNKLRFCADGWEKRRGCKTSCICCSYSSLRHYSLCCLRWWYTNVVWYLIFLFLLEMSGCMSQCLSAWKVYFLVYLPICLLDCLSVCLFEYCLNTYLAACLFVCRFIWLFVCFPDCLYACISDYLLVCWFACIWLFVCLPDFWKQKLIPNQKFNLNFKNCKQFLYKLTNRLVPVSNYSKHKTTIKLDRKIQQQNNVYFKKKNFI